MSEIKPLLIELNRQDGSVSKLMSSNFKNVLNEMHSMFFKNNQVPIVEQKYYDKIKVEDEPNINSTSWDNLFETSKNFSQFYKENETHIEPIKYVEYNGKLYLEVHSNDLKFNPSLYKINIRVSLPEKVESWIYSDNINETSIEQSRYFICNFVPLVFILEEI